MEYFNPNYRLPARNLFNFRREQFSRIKDYISRIIKVVEEFGFSLKEFDVKKSKTSKGSMSYTFSETINLVFIKGDPDDPNQNNIDLSMKIPCMFDDFHIFINGRKKIPRYQLFDQPLLKSLKDGNNLISIQTNIKRVSISISEKPPYVNILCDNKKIPLALILFAIYGCEKVAESLLFREGYKAGEYFLPSDKLKNVINIDPTDPKICHRSLTNRWDKLLFDIYDLYDQRTKEEYIQQIGLNFNKFNSFEKGSDFIFSLENLLKFDIVAQDLLGTDNMINLLLDLTYIENPPIDNLRYEQKRLRCIEYMILRHFIVNAHNMCISCRNTKKPKFNIAISKILADCNVSDIIIHDFSINPIDQLSKICQATLGGPNGFNKDNVPTPLRDLHPTMVGRVCPVDTPDRENCGVVQNLCSTVELDENYCFVLDQPNKLNITSIPVSMTPCLEHDDQVRLQMAASQMKQSVALNGLQKPLVSSGCSNLYTHFTDFLNIAEEDGEVLYKDYRRLIIGYKQSGRLQLLPLGLRDINMDNMDIMTTDLEKGDTFSKGQILTSSVFTKDRDIVWGANLKTAVMPYYGYNHEDGIVISDRLVEEGVLTSGHYVDLSFVIPPDKVLSNRWKPNEIRNCMVEEYIYKPIPFVHETVEKNEVYASLAAMPVAHQDFTSINYEPIELISPYKTIITKVELYANNWNKTIHEYRDWVEQTIESQKSKNQQIISIVKNCLDADEANLFINKHNLNVFEATGKYKLKEEKIDGIYIHMIGYYERPIQVGDKLANRHGNKGIISLIQERDKMPKDENGQPVDIIISPMGVPSRMNPGQLYELHLGEAVTQIKKQASQMLKDGKQQEDIKQFFIDFVKLLDKTNNNWYSKQFIEQIPQIIDQQFIDEFYILQPPFESVRLDDLKKVMDYAQAKYTQRVFDPLIGQHINTKVALGNMYFSKLSHIADMKLAARSVGIMSPKTMQPLSGKKNKGGQKMGEMETWAIVSLDMPKVANEMRTVKSDSIEKKDIVTKEIVYGKSIQLADKEVDTKPETNRLMESLIATLTIDIGELDL